jgi:hypothetical protein
VSAEAALRERLTAVSERLLDQSLRYEVRRDSRAVFTRAYWRITLLIRDSIGVTPFADAAWVAALAERFAAQYFAALEASESGIALGAAWTKVFATIADEHTTVLEDLVFSITAHIVHDLPLALTEVGLAGANGESHVFDFHLMNDVLGEHIDAIQHEVIARYQPALQWLDQIGPQDEILTNYGFRMSRGLAWYNANRLLDPRSTDRTRMSIEKNVVVVVDSVRKPPFWSLRLLFRIGRVIARWFRTWPAARR